MNKVSFRFVSIPVRVSVSLLSTASALLLASCSSSRTVGAEWELPAGRSVSKTVIDSDVMIASGSELEVAYSDRNRYFVAAGAALVGFEKGVQNTKIYAETGAVIPDRRRLRGFTVVTVKDAKKAYRDRYKQLPPPDMKPGTGKQVSVVPVVGVGVGAGFWGGGWSRWGSSRSRGASRPASVRPSSYKKKE